MHQLVLDWDHETWLFVLENTGADGGTIEFTVTLVIEATCR